MGEAKKEKITLTNSHAKTDEVTITSRLQERYDRNFRKEHVYNGVTKQKDLKQVLPTAYRIMDATIKWKSTPITLKIVSCF